MSEVFTYIKGKPYGLNPDYQIPEKSCWNCRLYDKEKRGCGTALIRDARGKIETQSCYAVCLKDGPKAYWEARK